MISVLVFLTTDDGENEERSSGIFYNESGVERGEKSLGIFNILQY